MTDREDRWYIVRGMGLVCNQAFLDEVDKAIIEEMKKSDTMTDWEITSLHEEDHASLRLSLLLKGKGFNWPCREWYEEKEQLGRKYTSRMSQEEWMRNTGNETPGFICTAPTLAYAEKWLRDEHGISIDVITDWEWVRDPMTMTQAELETPDISEFSGYYYEIHQLRPHRLLYDSPVVSEDRAKTLAVAIEKALGYIDGKEEEAQR